MQVGHPPVARGSHPAEAYLEFRIAQCGRGLFDPRVASIHLAQRIACPGHSRLAFNDQGRCAARFTPGFFDPVGRGEFAFEQGKETLVVIAGISGPGPTFFQHGFIFGNGIAEGLDFEPDQLEPRPGPRRLRFIRTRI